MRVCKTGDVGGSGVLAVDLEVDSEQNGFGGRGHSVASAMSGRSKS